MGDREEQDGGESHLRGKFLRCTLTPEQRKCRLGYGETQTLNRSRAASPQIHFTCTGLAPLDERSGGPKDH